MKKSLIWNILLILGIVPFALPVVWGIYSVITESWNLFDWLVMWSYVYWPTYLAGVIVIAVSIIGRMLKKKNEN